jgi:hypothetical protein
MLARALNFLRRNFRAALGLRSVIFFQSPPAGERAPFDGTLVEVDEARFQSWARSVPRFPWPNDAFSLRQDGKTRLYALIVDDKPVCMGWVSRAGTFPVNELGGHCDFEPETQIIWDCATLIYEWRKGYFTRFLVGLQAKSPATNFCIYCQPENLPSAGAIQKAGFRPWARARVSRFGRRISPLGTSSARVLFHS